LYIVDLILSYLQLLEKKDPQKFFAWPVTDKIAPGYSSIISQPMDFRTMKIRLDNGEYETLMEFAVSLTFQWVYANKRLSFTFNF
jgi:hypothetical protein